MGLRRGQHQLRLPLGARPKRRFWRLFDGRTRNAWLKGLSPKENRDIPPLRYEIVHQLKNDFPHLNIAINGGITTNVQIAEQLQHVDGVMVGREAYHNPWLLASWDEAFFDAEASASTRESIEAQMVTYMDRELAAYGTHWAPIARHMLGLRHGLVGSRRWRQVWSDHKLRDLAPAAVMQLAHQAMDQVSYPVSDQAQNQVKDQAQETHSEPAHV